MTTPSAAQQEVTQLLAHWSDGDEGALDKLIPLVQPELHRLAHHYMSRERTGHTLQTTALLNEAYLQLVDDSTRNWQNRTHFMAAAAQLMRRIMVDHARERCSLKRGGGALRVTLDDTALVTEKRSEELLALDEALERLTAEDPRKSRIVELRYFGGLTEKETAAFLKLSDRTVRREWRMARTWSRRSRSASTASGPSGASVWGVDPHGDGAALPVRGGGEAGGDHQVRLRQPQLEPARPLRWSRPRVGSRVAPPAVTTPVRFRGGGAGAAAARPPESPRPRREERWA